MAALTWRNVDAPDFTPAMRGFEQFTQLLDRGLSGARSALTQFDQAETERVSNRFIQDILTQYAENPDQLNADLQSGALFQGVNRDRLNTEALNVLARRPTELLNYATTAQRLEDAKGDTAYEGVVRQRETEDRAFQVMDRDAARAARPIAARLMSFDNEDDANAYWNSPEVQAVVAGLPADQQLALRRFPYQIIADDLGLDTTRKQHTAMDDQHNNAVFQLGRDQWTFGNEQIDRADQQAGMAFADGVLASSQSPEDALINMENDPRWAQMSPGARNVARNQVMGVFGNVYAPAGASGGTAGGSSGNSSFDGTFESAVGSLLDREGGFVSNDAGRGATNFGVNSQANPDVDVRSLTPQRATAIYRDRYWNPIVRAGVPVPAREAVFDFAVNAGVGRATDLWRQSGGDLARFNQLRLNHYERLARQDPAKYAQYLPSWRRRVQETSGVGSIAAIRTDAAVSSSQRNQGRGQNRWAEALGSESTPAEVAYALRSTPQFNNVPVTWISEQITDIVNRSRVNGIATLNETQAGQILARTTSRGSRGVIDRVLSLDFGDTNLGSGFSTDNDALNAAIEDARRGGFQNRQNINDAEASNLARIEAAQAAYDRAVAEQTRMIQSGRPAVIAANRDRLAARVEAARRQLVMAQSPVRETPSDGISWSDIFLIGR